MQDGLLGELIDRRAKALLRGCECEELDAYLAVIKPSAYGWSLAENPLFGAIEDTTLALYILCHEQILFEEPSSDDGFESWLKCVRKRADLIGRLVHGLSPRDRLSGPDLLLAAMLLSLEELRIRYQSGFPKPVRINGHVFSTPYVPVD